jgi:hypothetical protein
MTSVARVARGGLLLMLGMAVLTASSLGQSAPEKVTLKHVKYDELGRLVRAQEGKVVIVSFWEFD